MTGSTTMPPTGRPEVLAAHDLTEQLPLRGPQFSTYSPSDVGWLLTDLTDASVPDSGRPEVACYLEGVAAELRPAQYQPSAEYRRLLALAIDRRAETIARAIGTLTETVLDRLGDTAVLVSVMRAGVPIGVLMHRWARALRGINIPHYAVSIVLDAGIDANALRWVARHHDPADVIFVDGWTGKGTVALTFEHCLTQLESRHGIRFRHTLAVLADPGECVSLYGTREDFLVPSACLDSAACGLVSRTIYHPELIGATACHGAAFHRDLITLDESTAFVDAVTARYPAVAHSLSRSRPPMSPPTWAGRRAAESIAARFSVDHVDLVKPGVCETTRVLVQWRVDRLLIRRAAEHDLDHILLLASERAVPVEYFDDMPFSCVALVPPRPVLATATPTNPYREQRPLP